MPNRHQEILTRYAADTYGADGSLIVSSLEVNDMQEIDPFALKYPSTPTVESLTVLFPELEDTGRDQGEVVLITES